MQVCPRCHRTNPAEAVFCYFDGNNLRAPQPVGASADGGPQRLPHEFFFPSGRRCKTYDDLVQACQEEWGTARDMLQEGAFRAFLTGAGRMDLAKAADDARAHKDPDVALDTFLGKLPATDVPKPRLELEPRRLILGTLRAGDTMEAQLRVLNLGRGLLHGTLNVAEGGDWLRLGTGGSFALKTVRDQVVPIHIDTKALVAPQAYGARLTVITNGGIVEVPVRLNLAAHPFPKPPYQGAGSPRDLAVRFRGNPKPAAPLLESGEVARWFEQNKWPYPVNGPTASGMAAVQQFFESMGLAKPPTVRLSDAQLRYTCNFPDSIVGQTTLASPDRKWVYARVLSDAPWIRITQPVVSGPQKATVFFEIESRELSPGAHEGIVQVIANAGQTFQLRVSVNVVRGDSTTITRRTTRTERIEAPPVAVAVPVAMKARPAERIPESRPVAKVVELPPLPDEPEKLQPPAAPASLFRTIMMGAMLGLLLRLLLAGPADIYARLLASVPEPGVVAGSFAFWSQAPAGSLFVKHLVLATWWLGAVGGALVLGKRGSHWADVPCGLIAGAAAGVAGSATLACALPALDSLARAIWRPLASVAPADSVWVATLLWIVLAALCWTVMGASVGLVLGCAGRPGRQLLGGVGAPLAWILRVCGLKKLAALMTLS